MLEEYARGNGWKIYDCYIDDGYSGTNYNRPDFQRMLDDIEDDKINMVIVKDLSRLGRNYIMTGQYTDIYFPDRGVRFIALNDGIDTINADNDIAPFKNILKEMYAKDLSKKTRTAIRAKKQRGEYVASYAPYGYKKDPDNKNRLVVDETSAAVVRRIYEMCKSGKGSKLIAKALNTDGVLSPSSYRLEAGLRGYKQEKSRWNTTTVHWILRSRVYLGYTVQGVLDCTMFRRMPPKRKPEDEWIITPNTHEPIVDIELWEHVQTQLNSRKRVTKSGEIQLFAGFVKCEDCGKALSYAYSHGIPQYTCGNYRRYGREACTCHYIRKDTLEHVILDDIRRYARLAVEDMDGFVQRCLSSSDDKEEQRKRSLSTELSTAKARYLELDKIIKRLFEQSVSETITESRFHKLSSEYEAEQAGLEKRIDELQNELETVRQNRRDMSAWLDIIKDYTDIQELDRVVLTELIDKITVGEARMVGGEKITDVTIYYRFVGAVGHLSA